MKIVVCVKYTPDLASDRSFHDDHTTDRANVDGVLSELDEYAVEQALKIVDERTDAEVTYLTMGPADAVAALRKALSMGGDRAVHVLDDALRGSDALATSHVLAAALGAIGHDLVMCGSASTDGSMSVVPAMLAERLGVPQLTFAAEVTVDGEQVRIRRDGDVETVIAESGLPAVVSVTDQSGEARYPSFKGIMAAKKKPLETLSLADLGISPDDVGSAAAGSVVESITKRPPRQTGTVVADEGEGGGAVAEFLVAQKLI